MMRMAKLLLLLLIAVMAPMAYAQDPAPAPAAPAPAAPAPAAPAPAAPAPAAPAPADAAAAAPADAAAAPAEPPPAPLAPIDQVQIQAWISETNEQGLRELGTNLQYTRVVRGVNQSGAVQQVNTNTFNPRNPAFSVSLPAPDTSLFPPPLRPDNSPPLSNGVQTQAGGGLVANVIDPGVGQFDVIFRGIEQKSDLDLISKPEILVVNGATAEIHAGGQVPYQSITYDGRTPVGQLTVTWQNIGVNLKLTPTILTSDTVKIAITELGVSDIVRYDTIRGIDLPVFATRTQAGEVLVPDGQTLVIGGLSSRVLQKNERRVPILGTIPLIGIGFRGRNSKATNAHLLVFISPTIVNLRTLTPQAEEALEFWRDRRWENSERIGKEIETLQQGR